MTNLITDRQNHLEKLRHDAELYGQLQPIRTADLEKLGDAFRSILEIARNWSLGRTEAALRTRTN